MCYFIVNKCKHYILCYFTNIRFPELLFALNKKQNEVHRIIHNILPASASHTANMYIPKTLKAHLDNSTVLCIQ